MPTVSRAQLCCSRVRDILITNLGGVGRNSDDFVLDIEKVRVVTVRTDRVVVPTFHDVVLFVILYRKLEKVLFILAGCFEDIAPTFPVIRGFENPGGRCFEEF